MRNEYALLVGVEDYSTYDRSVDQPVQTSNLPGATGDVRARYRKAIDEMGFAPEGIRVLTSPRLSPADLGPEAKAENVGEATRDAIIAGIEWIARAMNRPASAFRVISFSGHGTLDRGVAVCPSDTTGSLSEVIDVAAECKRIGTAGAAHNLRVVLDCWHEQVGPKSIQTRLKRWSARQPAPAIRLKADSDCPARGILQGDGFSWGLPRQLIPTKYMITVVDGAGRAGDLLATIDTGKSAETWTLSPAQVKSLSSAKQLKIVQLEPTARLPSIPGGKREHAATYPTWQKTKNPPYSRLASRTTFQSGPNAYVYHDGTARGMLAITFETSTTGDGTARITLSDWYNPDTTENNIDLGSSGNSITLTRVDVASTPTYAGTCCVAHSGMSS